MKTGVKNKFSIASRLLSFSYAFRGILIVFSKEHNAWIHLFAAILVICAGIFFNISAIEWCLIVFAIGLVFIAEMINTAIEKLVDFVSPDFNDKAGIIKDIAAGAVLVAALIAAVIGLLVFWKYVFV
ncbi:MAG: diacylglycerol kinase [Bacteroidetes bacterium RIFOXYA12_FULL_35_11]|nr:MAG: diacylglycerol kinase [Bacteroidetes bacterium GWF2_35_48]OFY74426.1 MAG: diacylglycerol kinase [Bacteroidetes bacterium RIFOXYA12_FULL_35_11]OFY95926.1 MAG: diacylglycerol kinase [Bacteroidetes bacterium RIFOXYC12_FULL_35_7]HBX50696.1 diacylglycerol kinase [Bacteroidales bacterium]